MYKLLLKKGEEVRIRQRGAFEKTIKGSWTYTQEELEALYNEGHKTIVSKSKPKKDDNK